MSYYFYSGWVKTGEKVFGTTALREDPISGVIEDDDASKAFATLKEAVAKEFGEKTRFHLYTFTKVE